jgi:multiple sugar transport system permease protein
VVTAPAGEKSTARISATKWRNGISSTFVTLLALAILFIFLAPFAFMIFTSLKTPEQISIVGGPIWPAKPASFEYNGKNVEMFSVPLGQCAGFEGDTSTRNLAIVKKGRQESVFVDPNDAGRGEFTCAVSWRALERPWQFSPTWDNYKEVWEAIDYPRLMWNTTFYAIMTEIGVLISCTLVAFGFARFRFPGPGLPVHRADLDHLPAGRGHHHPHLHLLPEDRVDRNMATPDRAGVLRQCL